MNKYLRAAIEAVIRDAQTCSVDNHGFVNCMDSSHLAVLVVEYDKYCKKNNYPRIRLNTDSADSGRASAA